MFEFSSGIFFWTLINFIILLGLIYKFALPSFFDIVETEDAKRESLIKELAESTAESKRLMLEYQAKLADIHTESRKILDEARQEKEEIKKNELAKLLQEKQQVLDGLKQEASYERKKLLEDVYANASDIITLTLKKVFQKELTTRDHEALIQKSLEDMRALSNS